MRVAAELVGGGKEKRVPTRGTPTGSDGPQVQLRVLEFG